MVNWKHKALICICSNAHCKAPIISSGKNVSKVVLCGYTSVLGVEVAEKVYEKIREIERRGRYVEERKQ